MFLQIVHRTMLNFIQIQCMTQCEKVFKILSTLINYIRGLSLYIHQIQDLDFLSKTPKSLYKETGLVRVPNRTSPEHVS
jgi:hypothetical protein